ncbi:MAG: asparagine synthase-related protein, partial [Phycisphaeraceae bacterium]|nr:asparagine synthase-related protein [Phycisphaeraceae bacterium]
LLREIAGRLLPGLVAHRRKRGFSIPIGEWFRGPLEAGLADHLFSGSLADLGLDPAPARRWFDEHRNEKADHSHRLFALLELSLWAEWLRDPESAAVPEVDPVA